MSLVHPQRFPTFIGMSVQRPQASQSANHGPGPTSFRDPYGRKAPETFASTEPCHIPIILIGPEVLLDEIQQGHQKWNPKCPYS